MVLSRTRNIPASVVGGVCALTAPTLNAQETVTCLQSSANFPYS